MLSVLHLYYWTWSLKKVTVELAISGEILVGRACTRTSTFTCLKTNWKPSLFEYKYRSMYKSNNIDWVLLNVDTFLIKVEILWLHIKLICKLERIGGSILYVKKWNEHWIPFIYDLRMLWSPVQNFESALGITCPHSFPLDFISGSGDLLKED